MELSIKKFIYLVKLIIGGHDATLNDFYNTLLSHKTMFFVISLPKLFYMSLSRYGQEAKKNGALSYDDSFRLVNG